jgi:hypothetical protein
VLFDDGLMADGHRHRLVLVIVLVWVMLWLDWVVKELLNEFGSDGFGLLHFTVGSVRA